MDADVDVDDVVVADQPAIGADTRADLPYVAESTHKEETGTYGRHTTCVANGKQAATTATKRVGAKAVKVFESNSSGSNGVRNQQAATTYPAICARGNPLAQIGPMSLSARKSHAGISMSQMRTRLPSSSGSEGTTWVNLASCTSLICLSNEQSISTSTVTPALPAAQ